METSAQTDSSRPRIRWVRTVIGGVVLGLVVVLVGNLLFPEPREASEPPLLRGLPQTYEAATGALTDRARARFPVGTPESAVIAELLAQGFKVSPPSHYAQWQRKGVPCVQIARIWWSAEQNRVTKIEGLRNALCT
ncbi:hypothetical protein IAG41_12395 [Sphingomonas sp. JC676]|uniref:hypothetical protein n=1 Tax=Sphingomonas sp. JC676 TaxID=2768065 RepID=UPI001657CFBF|nr:hypothetical protein [Sphingomonas sp. JC676]MBC9033190.1 hypothetical protein [Sphingomonas sp. JC676]